MIEYGYPRLEVIRVPAFVSVDPDTEPARCVLYFRHSVYPLYCHFSTPLFQPQGETVLGNPQVVDAQGRTLVKVTDKVYEVPGGLGPRYYLPDSSLALLAAGH